MSVQFDYSEEVKCARQLVGEEAFQSEPINGPSDDVFYQAFFNPGHEGTADWLEYDFYVCWKHTAGGASESLSYKIQYLEDGGSWTDLHSGTTPSVGIGALTVERSTGILTASITMPIAIRIIGTATNEWQIYELGSETYDCFMRAVGSVS